MKTRLIALATLMLILCCIIPSNAADNGKRTAVQIIPYPQTVELSQTLFDKSKITNIRFVRSSKLAPEAYELHIRKNGIVVKSSNEAGQFYALQTLEQLKDSEAMYCGVVKDEPRFEWRGFMFDESRHFFGIDQVKTLLDLMARYKLNRFHWHLSDDQGWRIEIKAYPQLCQVGAIGCHTDRNAPARFYTQDQIREIVRYAAERHIEVIPEIDMPGHATAFTKSFPDLDGGRRTVNPGKEMTYEVLTVIIKELAELFPGRYIHIGGDEVSKRTWNELPEVHELMKRENIDNLDDVQNYFGRRLCEIVLATGKEVVAWDDLLSSGTDPEKKILNWWRTKHPECLDNGLEKGFRMIVCPENPFYLDYIQDINHTEGHQAKIKAVNDIKDLYEFKIADNPLIVGTQSNLWTERVRTSDRLEYMVFPRLIALAEKAWTESGNMDYDDFIQRIAHEFKYLDSIDINYYDFRDPQRHPEPLK